MRIPGKECAQACQLAVFRQRRGSIREDKQAPPRIGINDMAKRQRPGIGQPDNGCGMEAHADLEPARQMLPLGIAGEMRGLVAD